MPPKVTARFIEPMLLRTDALPKDADHWEYQRRVVFVLVLLAHERRRVVRVAVTAPSDGGVDGARVVRRFHGTPRPDICSGIAIGRTRTRNGSSGPSGGNASNTSSSSVQRDCVRPERVRHVLPRLATRLSLDKDAPVARALQPPACGTIVPVLHRGLHHHYEHRAAFAPVAANRRRTRERPAGGPGGAVITVGRERCGMPYPRVIPHSDGAGHIALVATVSQRTGSAAASRATARNGIVHSAAAEYTVVPPVAALTARARETDRLRALQSGFDVHIPKPVEPRALAQAVAGLVDSTRTAAI